MTVKQKCRESPTPESGSASTSLGAGKIKNSKIRGNCSGLKVMLQLLREAAIENMKEEQLLKFCNNFVVILGTVDVPLHSLEEYCKFMIILEEMMGCLRCAHDKDNVIDVTLAAFYKCISSKDYSKQVGSNVVQQHQDYQEMDSISSGNHNEDHSTGESTGEAMECLEECPKNDCPDKPIKQMGSHNSAKSNSTCPMPIMSIVLEMMNESGIPRHVTRMLQQERRSRLDKRRRMLERLQRQTSYVPIGTQNNNKNYNGNAGEDDDVDMDYDSAAIALQERDSKRHERALRTLLTWMHCWTYTPNLGPFITHFLRALETDDSGGDGVGVHHRHDDVLIDVALDHVGILFPLLCSPVCRRGVYPVVMHMLASVQHTAFAVEMVAADVPRVLEMLVREVTATVSDSEANSFVPVNETRRQITEILELFSWLLDHFLQNNTTTSITNQSRLDDLRNFLEACRHNTQIYAVWNSPNSPNVNMTTTLTSQNCNAWQPVARAAKVNCDYYNFSYNGSIAKTETKPQHTSPSVPAQEQYNNRMCFQRVGLENLGNTCYMNSVLQALFMTRTFRRELLLMPQTDARSPYSPLTKLQVLFARMLYSRKRTSLSPADVLNFTRPTTSTTMAATTSAKADDSLPGSPVRGGSGNTIISSTATTASTNSTNVSAPSHAFARVIFTVGYQHDSSEFMGYLMDAMHEHEFYEHTTTNLEVVNENHHQESSSQSNRLSLPTNDEYMSLIQRAFGGRNVTVSRCDECGTRSERADHFRELQLSFPQPQDRLSGQNYVSYADRDVAAVGEITSSSPPECSNVADVNAAGLMNRPLTRSLTHQMRRREQQQSQTCSVQTLLDYYFAPEQLCGENQYLCEKCRRLTDGVRYTRVVNPPSHLVLTLKQFRYEPTTRIRAKLMKHVTLDQTVLLDRCNEDDNNNCDAAAMSNDNGEQIHDGGFCGGRQQDGKAVYDLYAVVVHCGKSLDCGHYYTFARDGADWYKFNDCTVTLASRNALNEMRPPETPYILFYRQTNLVGRNGVLVEGNDETADVFRFQLPRYVQMALAKEDAEQESEEEQEEERRRKQAALSAATVSTTTYKYGGGPDDDDDESGGPPPPRSCWGGGGLNDSCGKLVY